MNYPEEKMDITENISEMWLGWTWSQGMSSWLWNQITLDQVPSSITD